MASTARNQIDWVVPSSARPPKSEWTLHLWYGLFTAAAQASPDLTDAEATELVALFTNAAAGLPCTACKQHYRENFKSVPFTLAHARSQRAALQWVVSLRRLVAAQVQAGAAKAASLPVCVLSRDAPCPPAAAFPDVCTLQERRLDDAVEALQKPTKRCDCNMTQERVLHAKPSAPKRYRSALVES